MQGILEHSKHMGTKELDDIEQACKVLLSQKYSGTNPTFIDVEAMRFIVEKGIQHILVDLPSVDREEDGGRLEAHNCFWMDGRAKKCTITELIYVPDSVPDGIYVLNLQTASIQSDAIPSKPILYQVR